ncbi:hypothetical protein B9Z55_024046 [Caenorhabditis nigoni]|uniref:Serpentine receptor class gamma n=1 Tax=Caenorhabditis nigoni TaxID=1611254 RepID=A0A2G5SSS8_9PELO|nr:hypothetical protein B9Z55_024046 [Caenorhabditis nigoni]
MVPGNSIKEAKANFKRGNRTPDLQFHHTRPQPLGHLAAENNSAQFYAETFFFLEFSLTMRFRKYTDFYLLFEPGTEFTGIVPRVISGVHYYVKVVVYIGYIVFAINRLLSALTVSSYNSQNISVWGPSTIRWITITQWSVPILAVLPTHAWPDFQFFLQITATAMRLNNDALSTAIPDGGPNVFTLSLGVDCDVVSVETPTCLRREVTHKEHFET